MKTRFVILSFFLTSFSAAGQTTIAGQYKLKTTGDSSEITQGVVLTLKCDNSFVQKDTFAIGYGKWYLSKNNELVLQFDSSRYVNGTFHTIAKMVYLIENGRIYRNKIPKKEYNSYVKETKEYLHSVNSPFRNVRPESFSVYKQKALRRYYQQFQSQQCN